MTTSQTPRTDGETGTFETLNPATGQVIATFPVAGFSVSNGPACPSVREVWEVVMGHRHPAEAWSVK